MKKQKIVRCCDKCGKLAQPDKEQSNENWNVYTIRDCECGGKFGFHTIEQQQKIIQNCQNSNDDFSGE